MDLLSIFLLRGASMNKTTLDYIVNAFEVAGDDATRFSLTNVRIESDGKETLRIVACDGHSLSVKTVKDECAPKFDKPVYFSRESLSLLKTLLKNWKAISRFEVTTDDKGISVKLGETPIRMTFETKDFYPDYQSVIPKIVGKKVELGLNPELLISVLKALRNEKEQVAVKLVFDPTKKYSPIVVQVGDDSGVVMPMRI